MTDPTLDYSNEQTWSAILGQCTDIVDDLIDIFIEVTDEQVSFCTARPCGDIFQAEKDNVLCKCFQPVNTRFFDDYLPRRLKKLVAGMPQTFTFPSFAKLREQARTKQAHLDSKKPVQKPGVSIVTGETSAPTNGSTSPAPGELNTTDPGADSDISGLDKSIKFNEICSDLIKLLGSDDDLSEIFAPNSFVHEDEPAIAPLHPGSVTRDQQGSEPRMASPEILCSPSQGLVLTLGNTTDTSGTSQVLSTNVEFIAVDSEVGIRGPNNSTPKPSRQGSPNPPMMETPISRPKQVSHTQTKTNVSPNTSIRGTHKKNRSNNQNALYFPFANELGFGCLSYSQVALQKYCNSKQINYTIGESCSTIKIWPEGKSDYEALSRIHTLENHSFKLMTSAPTQPIRYTIRQCPQSVFSTDIKRAFPGAYHIVHIGKQSYKVIEFSAEKEFSETVTIKSSKYIVERSPIELVNCFNCHDLGHHGKTCKSKTRCGKCAHEHQSRTCKTPKWEWTCARCIQADFNGPCTPHNAYGFTDCPVREKAKDALNRKRLADQKGKINAQLTLTTPQVANQVQKRTPSLENRRECPPPQQTGISGDIPTQSGPNQQHAGSKVNNLPRPTKKTQLVAQSGHIKQQSGYKVNYPPLPAPSIQLAEQSRTIRKQSGNIVHTTLPPIQTTQAPQQVSSEQSNGLESAMQMAQHNIVMLYQMCNDGYQERHALELNMKRMYTEICDIKSINSVLTHRVNQLQQWQQSVVPNMVIQEFKQFLAHRQEFTNFLSLKYNR